jgi:hypothetical protein
MLIRPWAFMASTPENADAIELKQERGLRFEHRLENEETAPAGKQRNRTRYQTFWRTSRTH